MAPTGDAQDGSAAPEVDFWAIARGAVSLLTLMVAAYYVVVAFDNLTNPASNWAFVKGVMTLDGVVPDSGFEWRAINITAVQVAAYVVIIAAEVAAAGLLLLGAVGGLRAVRHHDVAAWTRSQRRTIQGLVVVLALFFFGFIVVGGNWFVMYLNSKWNGLAPAFENSAVALLVLLAVIGVGAASNPD